MAKRGRKAGSTGAGGKRSRSAAKSGTTTPRRTRRKSADAPPMSDYRHEATRKNNPPAKIAAEGIVPVIPRAQYAYNPHLPPVHRFDQTGNADELKTHFSAGAHVRADELLTAVQQRLLKRAEVEPNRLEPTDVGACPSPVEVSACRRT